MNNPLLTPFNTAHETAPFKDIENRHFLPAIEATIAEAKAEITAITESAAAPDFKNTIEALSQSGRRLDVVRNILFNLNSAETGDELQQIAQKAAALLAQFNPCLDGRLFARVSAVYEQQDRTALTPEQQTLLEQTYEGFIRCGAALSETDKQRYQQIAERLSALSLTFQENVLADQNAFSLHITDESDLEGLPPSARTAARDAARQRNLDGWLFSLHAPSYMPFMKYSARRHLRHQMYLAFGQRGNHGGTRDNKHIIREIVALKHEKARLLGYADHAAFKLKHRMAETPDTVMNFLTQLHNAARPHAVREFAEVAEYARQCGLPDDLQPWDWTFYAEKLKDARYGFNEEELKPYFRLENVINGVFALATRLYGLTFRENPNIQTYHPDVKAYEAYDTDNQFVAVLYMDFFPREGKRSGAWMTDFRAQYSDQSRDVRPHISIVTNFTKPAEKSPSLLTFNEVTTILHEFGHALHGMLSRCRYSDLSGTSVFLDFVELPSQLHENWAYEREWLDSFARHVDTGAKIPAELLDKIIGARNFLSGYFFERQLSFGFLDMAYYQYVMPLPDDLAAFERDATQLTALFAPVEGVMTGTAFLHIFAGGYDAGYYSYKWAEALEADAFALFAEHGIFDRQTADSLRTNILERGGSEHPMLLYSRFRGRIPSPDALLRRSGLL
ncbi:MAG: M3 family metallopeptidase [Bacteroidales bacterium]|jgi:peptidyl-dipeptidase Dcp|nr:M3 family metallopeptidase [Bacteroidales bacterium]